MRPIDIARKLNISTTTLRSYEALGMLPSVLRSESGYRVYSAEHLAYFVCIREMLKGFSLPLIADMLRDVQAKRIEAALWTVNKAQAELQQEKVISEKMMLNLLQEFPAPTRTPRRFMNIHEVSRETGVPASTIRYWDRVRLLAVERDAGNNYRLFTTQHIRQILTIYALKFAVYAESHQYSVTRVKAELEVFDPHDSERMHAIVADMRRHLDRANRAQIASIAALYHLCVQVETNLFDTTD